MKRNTQQLLFVIIATSLLSGCIAALAPAGVIGAQKSGAFAETEDDLYKLISRQYGVDRSQLKISDIDQEKHWNTTETFFNVSFNNGKKLRCQVSSALGSNGDMALCDETGSKNAPADSSKCNALLKAAGKCKS